MNASLYLSEETPNGELQWHAEHSEARPPQRVVGLCRPCG